MTYFPDPVKLYDLNVDALAERYDALSFEAVHSGFMDLLPATGAAVLDIGAGSGRDARALAALGFRVTAVEPSAAFRKRSAGDRITWINDRLPDLASIHALNQRFPFILCSAVLMLLPGDQLAPSLTAIALLLEDDGVLAINLRGPVPNEPENLVHFHPDELVISAAKSAGLRLVRRDLAADSFGRVGYLWRNFVFARDKLTGSQLRQNIFAS